MQRMSPAGSCFPASQAAGRARCSRTRVGAARLVAAAHKGAGAGAEVERREQVVVGACQGGGQGSKAAPPMGGSTCASCSRGFCRGAKSRSRAWTEEQRSPARWQSMFMLTPDPRAQTVRSEKMSTERSCMKGLEILKLQQGARERQEATAGGASGRGAGTRQPRGGQARGGGAPAQPVTHASRAATHSVNCTSEDLPVHSAWCPLSPSVDLVQRGLVAHRLMPVMRERRAAEEDVISACAGRGDRSSSRAATHPPNRATEQPINTQTISSQMGSGSGTGRTGDGDEVAHRHNHAVVRVDDVNLCCRAARGRDTRMNDAAGGVGSCGGMHAWRGEGAALAAAAGRTAHALTSRIQQLVTLVRANAL